MNKDIERQIEKIYKEVWKKVFTEQSIKKATNKKSQQLNIVIHNLTKSKDYTKFCQKFAKQLALKGLNKQKGLWKKYYDVAKKLKLGVLQTTYSEYERAQLENAVKRNFKMIKSIPQDILGVLKEKGVKTIVKQVAEGTVGRGTFESFLAEKGAKRAKLIARTETAKLQTAIMEKRATDLGSVCYQWSSTRDKRTRQSHKDMNNVIVFWRESLEERPFLDNMYGNAGEFPNCRCTPEPIFDESDLPNTRYKVYNYKSKKVITVAKTRLLKLIEQGGFE